MGRGGATPTEARWVGAALLVAGLAVLLLGVVLRASRADLRDLSALRVADADVVDVDERRKGPDLLEVAYPVQGREPQRAQVPYSDEGPRVTTGSRVPVAYAPGDPSRVRTVDGWSPRYRLALLLGSLLAPMGLLLLVVGLLSRGRTVRS